MSPEEEAPKVPTQFTLLNIFITKAVYEFTGEEFKLQRPPKLNVNVEVGASVKLFADLNGAFVELNVKCIPDQEWQPYKLEVKIAAVFQAQGGTADELLNFCRVAAPSILFPYIRETIHRMTMDAPAGTVRLDPMNISSLLNQTEWQVSQVTAPDPSGPPPPSSQSVSASSGSEQQP